MLKSFISGAIVLASWAISMFFLRFQATSKDRLFGFFAAAFILLGLERVSADFIPDGRKSYVYLIRLLAFLLILFAIWDKNRKEKIT